MGIFDKKTPRRKNEDFDSPVETIDLNSEASEATSSAKAATPIKKEGDTEKASAKPEPAKKEAPAPAKAPAKAPAIDQDYGIEEAIALMRTLPTESVELVVSVVRQTLRSTNIDIPLIIEDATAKEKRIDERIAILKAAIIDFEQEIASRKEEIAAITADREETSLVKSRLELAVTLGTKEAAKAKSKPALTSEPKKSAGDSAKK